jgi:4-hydroxy-tetrahydrodipicolinate reductase
MGKRIIACAAALPDMRVSCAVEYKGHPALGEDSGVLAGCGTNGVPLTYNLREACRDASVVIDFALADGVAERAAVYAAAGVPLVMGTTAVDSAGEAALEEAARVIPVMHAPNFSIGVNLLFALTRQAAAALDAAYDVEVIEMHHKRKKDAPSGTALRLVAVIENGRQCQPGSGRIFGRSGMTGERPEGEIGIHAVRGGDVVGEHTVVFAAEGERVELTHKASSRDTFARGALRAARYVIGKPAGMYSMNNLLGFTTEKNK